MKNKHVHEYVMGKSGKVSICTCGRFRHEGDFTPIVEIQAEPCFTRADGECVAEGCMHDTKRQPSERSEHTPTPWITNGKWIETDVTIGKMDTTHDAAFIVLAVNAHEELLAIIKDIYDDENDITRRKHSDAMRFRMEEAIAKAEGK